jgi:hypothetical protein
MNIYILWFQGFDKAPQVVQWCAASWKRYNPTWNIILLDNTNLKEYVDLNQVSYSKDIELCHLADIVRMILLRDHGGLWVDATAFCHKPLNEWFLPYMVEGFFAFDKPYSHLMLSNWFLYAEKNNPILSQWCEETLYYYQVHGTAHTYFVHHYIFEQLYQDVQFQKEWDKVPKLSGSIPHTLQIDDFFKTNGGKDIDSKRVPVYKLSYKCTFPPYDPRMNVYYLLSTI